LELRAGTTPEGAPALLCPRCHGVLLPRREMAGVVERLAASLATTVSPDVEISVSDPGPLGPCPRCVARMEHYGYMGSSKVLIDHCPACDGVWLDASELGAMALMVARMDRRLAERGTALEQVHRDAQQVADWNQLTDAAGKAALTGAVVGPLLAQLLRVALG
jgi:Zn-finger nucleic acid-binding protein